MMRKLVDERLVRLLHVFPLPPFSTAVHWHGVGDLVTLQHYQVSILAKPSLFRAICTITECTDGCQWHFGGWLTIRVSLATPPSRGTCGTVLKAPFKHNFYETGPHAYHPFCWGTLAAVCMSILAICLCFWWHLLSALFAVNIYQYLSTFATNIDQCVNIGNLPHLLWCHLISSVICVFQNGSHMPPVHLNCSHKSLLTHVTGAVLIHPLLIRRNCLKISNIKSQLPNTPSKIPNTSSNIKHRKNCECCPVSLLIVMQQRLSWIQVLNCQKCN